MPLLQVGHVPGTKIPKPNKMLGPWDPFGKDFAAHGGRSAENTGIWALLAPVGPRLTSWGPGASIGAGNLGPIDPCDA